MSNKHKKKEKRLSAEDVSLKGKLSELLSKKELKDKRQFIMNLKHEEQIEDVLKRLDDPSQYVSLSFRYFMNEGLTNIRAAQYNSENIISRFREITSHTWEECNCAQKHQVIGCELIPFDHFLKRNDLPRELSDYMEDAMCVFRIDGENHAMVGLRLYDVFYALFVEYNWGDAYPHDRNAL